MCETVADRKLTTARKAHRCNMCTGTIEGGARYLRSVAAGEGRVWTWREHPECLELWEALVHHPLDDCIPDGDLLGWIDYWGSDLGRLSEDLSEEARARLATLRKAAA